jgi:hypothetical protein
MLFLHEQAGDLDDVRAIYEAEADCAFDRGEHAAELQYLCFVAQACARFNDRDRAEDLLARLEPVSGFIASTSSASWHAVATCCGMLCDMLGRHEDADRHFTGAIAICTGFRAPYLLASAQLEWARVLLQRMTPELERARPLLDDALASARHYGFGGIERDALDLNAPFG